MAKIFSEEQLRAVTVEAVRDYFARRGWTPTERAGGGLLFRNSDGPGTYFFPDSDTYYDYPLRVEDLLMARSKLEDRPVVAVWQELAKQTLTAADHAAKNGARA